MAHPKIAFNFDNNTISKLYEYSNNESLTFNTIIYISLPETHKSVQRLFGCVSSSPHEDLILNKTIFLF